MLRHTAKRISASTIASIITFLSIVIYFLYASNITVSAVSAFPMKTYIVGTSNIRTYSDTSLSNVVSIIDCGLMIDTAEAAGFEPARRLCSPGALAVRSLNHLGTPPCRGICGGTAPVCRENVTATYIVELWSARCCLHC